MLPCKRMETKSITSPKLLLSEVRWLYNRKYWGLIIVIIGFPESSQINGYPTNLRLIHQDGWILTVYPSKPPRNCEAPQLPNQSWRWHRSNSTGGHIQLSFFPQISGYTTIIDKKIDKKKSSRSLLESSGNPKWNSVKICDFHFPSSRSALGVLRAPPKSHANHAIKDETSAPALTHWGLQLLRAKRSLGVFFQNKLPEFFLS